MIDVTNLTKRYKDLTVVDNISFHVAEGETLGLIGTSGCGKTTTLKMLNRLIEPDSGQILIAGQEISRRRPEVLRQSIGYVIQNIGLFPHYTVADNVAVVPRLLKWKEKNIVRRTSELLKLVGLAPEKFARRYPQELSGGQKQRVGLARALAVDPPIILLDEPFGALDQITKRQIQQEFKQLESLLNKTIVLVTHDIFEAVTLCDRICLMDQGKIRQIGTPKELIFNPHNDFVRNFFQAYLFQLELQVTTLKDLLPWLSKKETDTENFQEHEENTSLLKILEQIQTSLKNSFIQIKNSQHSAIAIVSGEDLLAAFYQFKESLHNNS
ncbi:ATP-binding cassette domain-containing protein [Nodularia spumigena CS-584]|jgi:osmoprotectant transport system ATP-binding protein|uniref:ABC transporter ATP-binding protein n=1 Tax=Nodularia spumigena TaxID=70799 RepID=UPI0000EAD94E|nr:ATP-binding cassette domain-containing protein [Nodularia spumigena]AHJ27042.1 L-proline glycine betaine ABC transport system permease protein ProV [Nodularia spumigena CCY9414]EAW47388.1 glycine/betaine transport ATP-binding protein [Nodularia spumigena CCY9414]MDB9382888.1 ATP-binding cassette domain-containing protein [Nodularia spumigena CS-584]